MLEELKLQMEASDYFILEIEALDYISKYILPDKSILQKIVDDPIEGIKKLEEVVEGKKEELLNIVKSLKSLDIDRELKMNLANWILNIRGSLEGLLGIGHQYGGFINGLIPKVTRTTISQFENIIFSIYRYIESQGLHKVDLELRGLAPFAGSEILKELDEAVSNLEEIEYKPLPYILPEDVIDEIRNTKGESLKVIEQARDLLGKLGPFALKQHGEILLDIVESWSTRIKEIYREQLIIGLEDFVEYTRKKLNVSHVGEYKYKTNYKTFQEIFEANGLNPSYLKQELDQLKSIRDMLEKSGGFSKSIDELSKWIEKVESLESMYLTLKDVDEELESNPHIMPKDEEITNFGYELKEIYCKLDSTLRSYHERGLNKIHELVNEVIRSDLREGFLADLQIQNLEDFIIKALSNLPEASELRRNRGITLAKFREGVETEEELLDVWLDRGIKLIASDKDYGPFVDKISLISENLSRRLEMRLITVDFILKGEKSKHKSGCHKTSKETTIEVLEDHYSSSDYVLKDVIKALENIIYLPLDYYQTEKWNNLCAVVLTPQEKEEFVSKHSSKLEELLLNYSKTPEVRKAIAVFNTLQPLKHKYTIAMVEPNLLVTSEYISKIYFWFGKLDNIKSVELAKIVKEDLDKVVEWAEQYKDISLSSYLKPQTHRILRMYSELLDDKLLSGILDIYTSFPSHKPPELDEDSLPIEVAPELLAKPSSKHTHSKERSGLQGLERDISNLASAAIEVFGNEEPNEAYHPHTSHTESEAYSKNEDYRKPPHKHKSRHKRDRYVRGGKLKEIERDIKRLAIAGVKIYGDMDMFRYEHRSNKKKYPYTAYINLKEEELGER